MGYKPLHTYSIQKFESPETEVERGFPSLKSRKAIDLHSRSRILF